MKMDTWLITKREINPTNNNFRTVLYLSRANGRESTSELYLGFPITFSYFVSYPRPRKLTNSHSFNHRSKSTPNREEQLHRRPLLRRGKIVKSARQLGFIERKKIA
ncbi:unnamed protein product [Lathyrus sativus]|nr:unnamed protein product [Lathyrus sativus]